MEFLEEIADGFRIWPEAPLYHRPDELNLKYETVTFPSEDGVPLEGWFFPCNGSDKIIIMNHPRLFNRAGLPSHIEPWNTLTAPLGNNFDVNFIPDYKILHDAGYNVLTHDFRNYGMSGRGNNVLYSGGCYESYDVIGALRYIRKHKDTKDMTIGLFPQCMGGSATFFAMGTHPEEFKDIRTIVFPQPISANMSSKVTLQTAGIDLDYLKELDDMVYWRTSLHLENTLLFLGLGTSTSRRTCSRFAMILLLTGLMFRMSSMLFLLRTKSFSGSMERLEDGTDTCTFSVTLMRFLSGLSGG
ncbi:hypothetical protein FOYG_00951 [Fusarium oxysporum NRRL 32931]|uniref:Serine aminopeptidase S33 domain-containing protein n=1 Tax=Fusarium oxysporum NRRL 32931 TaxID=660029 RepID=W9J2Q8_FUSOX|nr:hypothetical protein FOYG_00951 [Fusarium oxysporum NRRL 32931]